MYKDNKTPNLIDVNNLDLDDYQGFYILDNHNNYVDGPFDSINIASHEFDIRKDSYQSNKIEKLSDTQYKHAWFVEEKLEKSKSKKLSN